VRSKRGSTVIREDFGISEELGLLARVEVQISSSVEKLEETILPNNNKELFEKIASFLIEAKQEKIVEI
jgi:hypothetical protein